ncbi:DUF6207 family protein [Streptomyces sp. NBC_00696]|uniref:DUF6207 family protein n=1 Tax=Streptomyces sp. NBC_00696 TaxID=2903672 RepID=UPI002E359D70|nr:DUF6207 family protein [Streptomyces sp. NBC_00696]
MDIAAADDETAAVFQQALSARWATATADRTTRTPGEPGVRLRRFPGPAPGNRRIAAGRAPAFLVP